MNKDYYLRMNIIMKKTLTTKYFRHLNTYTRDAHSSVLYTGP